MLSRCLCGAVCFCVELRTNTNSVERATHFMTIFLVYISILYRYNIFDARTHSHIRRVRIRFHCARTCLFCDDASCVSLLIDTNTNRSICGVRAMQSANVLVLCDWACVACGWCYLSRRNDSYCERLLTYLRFWLFVYSVFKCAVQLLI